MENQRSKNQKTENDNAVVPFQNRDAFNYHEFCTLGKMSKMLWDWAISLLQSFGRKTVPASEQEAREAISEVITTNKIVTIWTPIPGFNGFDLIPKDIKGIIYPMMVDDPRFRLVCKEWNTVWKVHFNNLVDKFNAGKDKNKVVAWAAVRMIREKIFLDFRTEISPNTLITIHNTASRVHLGRTFTVQCVRTAQEHLLKYTTRVNYPCLDFGGAFGLVYDQLKNHRMVATDINQKIQGVEERIPKGTLYYVLLCAARGIKGSLDSPQENLLWLTPELTRYLIYTANKRGIVLTQ